MRRYWRFDFSSRRSSLRCAFLAVAAKRSRNWPFRLEDFPPKELTWPLRFRGCNLTPIGFVDSSRHRSAWKMRELGAQRAGYEVPSGAMGAGKLGWPVHGYYLKCIVYKYRCNNDSRPGTTTDALAPPQRALNRGCERMASGSRIRPRCSLPVGYNGRFFGLIGDQWVPAPQDH